MGSAVYVLRASAALHASLAVALIDIPRLETLLDASEDVMEWTPPTAQVVESPGGSRLLPDHPYLLSHLPCFSDRAVTVLEPLLNGCGRLWPIATPASNFYAFQITSVTPALDARASSFLRYPDGDVFLITSHVFDNRLIADSTIFRVPLKHRSAPYVTQTFVDAVEAARLTGFTFHQVWDGREPVTAGVSGW